MSSVKAVKRWIWFLGWQIAYISLIFTTSIATQGAFILVVSLALGYFILILFDIPDKLWEEMK